MIDRLDEDEKFYLWRFVNSPAYIKKIASEINRRDINGNCSECVSKSGRIKECEPAHTQSN